MLALASKRRIAAVDPRIEAYAKLLVERSLDVQPGWQVWINSSPLGRPLVEEVVRLIARRGAYPLVRLGGAGMEDVPFETIWALEAPEDALAEVAPADRHAWETMDAWMNIGAPENTASGAELSPERRALLAKARHPMRTRRLSDEIPWVACRFPTPALAQDSRMSLAEFEDFLYGACLLDWDAEGRRMAKIKERFDRASEVRIVGAGTDLTLSLEGREGEVDAGHANMPGGEVYFCPVEDATEGVVDFSEFPAFQEPDEIEGVRMVYRAGRVVEASANAPWTATQEAATSPARSLVSWHAAAARFLGTRDQVAARLGDGQVQLPLPLLHAGGGARVARTGRVAELRGDRAARARARAHGRRRGAADRWGAPRPARPAYACRDARRNARRPRPLTDDERRPPRPLRRAAGRGRPPTPQRLARLALARPLRRDHPPRRARPRPRWARAGRP